MWLGRCSFNWSVGKLLTVGGNELCPWEQQPGVPCLPAAASEQAGQGVHSGAQSCCASEHRLSECTWGKRGIWSLTKPAACQASQLQLGAKALSKGCVRVTYLPSVSGPVSVQLGCKLGVLSNWLN